MAAIPWTMRSRMGSRMKYEAANIAEAAHPSQLFTLKLLKRG
jgi:hypothetical protein